MSSAACVHMYLCYPTADGSDSRFTQLFIKTLPTQCLLTLSFGKPSHLTSCAHSHCIICRGKTVKNTFAVNN